MALDYDNALKLAAQAQRGHLRGLGQLLRMLINELSPPLLQVTLAVTTQLGRLAHAGKNIIMRGAGSARTFTLPASTGLGDIYRFEVGEVNTSNYVIKVANASDIMQGSIVMAGDEAADVATVFETTGTSDTLTLNGTTSGGVSIGDWIELRDSQLNKWSVTGICTESGVEVTPFSATV